MTARIRTYVRMCTYVQDYGGGAPHSLTMHDLYTLFRLQAESANTIVEDMDSAENITIIIHVILRYVTVR